MTTNLPPGAAPPASPDHQHVQFASYPSPGTTNNVTIAPLQRSSISSNESDPKEHDRNQVINSTSAKVWTPLPLRPIFYIPYILFLILLAVALEIAFHFSQKNTGFRVHGDPDALGKQSGVWHYIYTLPLVALAMFIVGVWAWTDIEIKKLQPYVDLVQGNSPPHRSLLLDYTRHHNLLVWMPALSNKHYTVLLTSLLAIISLAFQPLAAALLEVRDIWWSLPVRATPVNTVLGLTGGIGNVNTPVGDMSVFLSASGYAAATALYSDLPNPPFVAIATDGSDAGWTLMDVKIPPELPRNGSTLALNVTAVKTLVNCHSTPVTKTQTDATAGAWSNVIQDQATGCGLTFNVSRTGPNLFGSSVAICSNQGPVQTRPVIFWFFTYQPEVQASATICQPTIQLFDVSATLRLDGPSTSTSPLDGSTLGGGDVVSVVQKGTFDVRKSPFAGSAGNLSTLVNSTTGTIPAFNGLDWDASLTSNDSAIRNRLSGVQLTMPAAIFQAATSGGVGVQGAFGSDRFVTLSTNVYTAYLSLVAKSLYFVPAAGGTTVNVQPKTTVKRLFLSAFSTHFLTALLLLIAVISIFIQLTHTYSRRNLHLRHLPGTIASAVSIGGGTSTSALLSEYTSSKHHSGPGSEAGSETRTGAGATEEDLKSALRERRFRIDPRTMKIVMEGEDGYDYASSPNRGEFQWVGEALKKGGRRVSGVFLSAGEGGGGGWRRRSVLRPTSMLSVPPRSPRSPRTPGTPGSGALRGGSGDGAAEVPLMPRSSEP